MDVGSSLFIIFVTQSCLDTVRAELQIEDIVGTLDDIIQPCLEKD